ncbi:MAG: VOC family protein [Ignavibacteriae bacterium]|nr:MAG: VOC family protein [Ignavibacteriota bacterium]
MKLRKIDCIMHFTEDVEASQKFYTDILGLKLLWKDEKYKMTGLGLAETGAEIVLHQEPDIPQNEIHYLVDDVEKFCKEFKSCGGKIYTEPFDIRCGKCAVISDNEGSGISILDLTKMK